MPNSTSAYLTLKRPLVADPIHNLGLWTRWHVHFLFVEASPLSARTYIALCSPGPSAMKRSMGLMVPVWLLDVMEEMREWYEQRVTVSDDL